MRTLFILALVMFSGMALASENCYFDMNISQDRHFEDYNSAERWCQTVRGVFDDFEVCNVRRDNDRYQCRVRYSKRFGGNGQSYSRIMRDYSTWSHGVMWRGNNYKQTLQYHGNCLSDEYQRGRGY